MRAGALLAALGLLATQTSQPVTAGSGDRTLWLYHTHTHETARFTFKHNGQYDQNVLNQMNIFLADWRNKKTARMDPHLFDLLWEVAQDVGATQPFNIVSAYRSPETNAYLRSRSSAVAEHSQHMLGHAMDVFIPGVPLDKLRAAAMRHQVGGVGFYPTSGSPFVHMDVGSVRAWPRMTRAQLVRLFPDGKTLHLPVDGTPLSSSGRLYAEAQWNKCHMVPCRTDGAVPAIDTETDIRVAALDPAQRTVSTINIVAPVPMPSLGSPGVDDQPATAVASIDPSAIMPLSKTPALLLATRGRQSIDGESALAAIDSTAGDTVSPMPLPRVLLSPGEAQMLTAYAPEITPDPGAQKALEMIIARETTASVPDPSATPPAATGLVSTTELRTASLGGTNGLSIMKNIFDMTWSAVTEANGQSAIASTVAPTIDPAPVMGLRQRKTELIAPEIDHVNETLATPVLMTSMHFADMTEPEGYLDNAAELGPLANRIMIESDLVAPPRYDRFLPSKPPLIAARS